MAFLDSVVLPKASAGGFLGSVVAPPKGYVAPTPVAPVVKPTPSNPLTTGVTQGFTQTIKDFINGAQSDVAQVKNAFSSGITQATKGATQANTAGGNLLQRGEGILNFGGGLANAAFAPVAPVFSPIGQLINAAGEQLAKTPLISQYGKDVQQLPENQDPAIRILTAIQNVSTIGQAILGSGLLKGKAEIAPTKLPVESSGVETPIPVHNADIPLPVEHAPTVEPPTFEEANVHSSPENLKTQIGVYQDALDQDPAKELLKYYGRNDPRYSNLDDIFSRNVGTGAKSAKLDDIVQELGFSDVQAAHDAVIKYLDTKAQVTEMKNALAAVPKEQTTRSTTQTLKPIEGTGDIKTRGLSQNVEAAAIEKQLTDHFGDLPEYKQVSMKEQAQSAADLLEKDPAGARAIALGEKAPPKGLLPESVFVAAERDAAARGDAQMLKDLANSKLSASATTMGQRIRTLGERDETSPVAAIQDIQKARAEAQAARGTTLDKEVPKIKAAIRKTNTKENWSSFVESITC